MSKPYKGPINRSCSACSAGDTKMEYHDHDYVPLEERRPPHNEHECDGTNCPPRAHDHKLLI